MDFIATLIGNHDALVLGKNNLVSTSGLDGFHAVVYASSQRRPSVENPAHDEGACPDY